MFYKWFRRGKKHSKGIILKIKVTDNSTLYAEQTTKLTQ